MAEMHGFCYPASSAPAAADCKWESGQSGEVTELSATNSLFIDFSKLGLGWAGVPGGGLVLYVACQECRNSAMISLVF